MLAPHDKTADQRAVRLSPTIARVEMLARCTGFVDNGDVESCRYLRPIDVGRGGGDLGGARQLAVDEQVGPAHVAVAMAGLSLDAVKISEVM